MTIKLTERLIDNLQQLIDMKRVSYSAFPQSVRDILLEDGLVVVENRGTRRYVRVISIEALKGALPRYNEALRDLEAARAWLAHACPRYIKSRAGVTVWKFEDPWTAVVSRLSGQRLRPA